MTVSPLKAERKRRGWSQDELAKTLGVGVATVRRWEQGRTVPYPYYRKKLATIFDRTPQELGLLSDVRKDNQMEQALPSTVSPETAEEASLQADPAMPEAVNSARSLLRRPGVLEPIKQRLWSGSLRNGGLGSMGSVSTFHPLYSFSWHPIHIRTILIAVMIITAGLLAFSGLLRPSMGEHSAPPLPNSVTLLPNSVSPLSKSTFGQAPSYSLEISNSNSSLLDMARRLQQAFKAVYPQLVNRFARDPAAVAATVTLTFASDLPSLASSSSTSIRLDADWMREHSTQIGILTHELALLLQAYPAGAPDWFSSGMADYARSLYGPADDTGWSLPDRVEPQESYTQGGGITARFLLWLEQQSRLDIVDHLHFALQKGEPFSVAFHRLTQHSVDEFWTQYQAHPDITLAPEQRYKTATSRKPLFQSSHQLYGSYEQKYEGQHWLYNYAYAQDLFLSNFTMQADITTISGDLAGFSGFFFRNNDTDWYSACVSPDGDYSLERSCQLLASQPGSLSFSSAIKQGLKQTNRLTIIVEKSSIYLYINAQFITKIDDHRLSYGTLGVHASQITTSVSPVVRFEKLQVF